MPYICCYLSYCGVDRIVDSSGGNYFSDDDADNSGCHCQPVDMRAFAHDVDCGLDQRAFLLCWEWQQPIIWIGQPERRLRLLPACIRISP